MAVPILRIGVPDGIFLLVSISLLHWLSSSAERVPLALSLPS